MMHVTYWYRPVLCWLQQIVEMHVRALARSARIDGGIVVAGYGYAAAIWQCCASC